MTYDRYGEAIAAEVAALEREIRAHILDLEEAFSVRDWAAVARVYRSIAALADRLEELDPASRSRVLEQAERAQAALDETYIEETDELDEIAMRGSDALAASRFLDPDGADEDGDGDDDAAMRGL